MGGARSGALAALALALAPAAASAGAGPSLQLAVGAVGGAGWSVEGLRAGIEPVAGRARVELRVAALRLAGRGIVLRHLRILCAGARVDAGGIDCTDGSARLVMPGVRRSPFAVRFHYRFAPRSLDLSIPALPWDAGPVDLQAGWSGGRWSAEARAPDLAVAKVLELARRLGWRAEGVSASGRAGLRVAARGTRDGRYGFRARVAVRGLDFGEPSGRYAAQGFSGVLSGSGRRGGDGSWRGRVRVRLRDGQLYVEPLYLAVDRRRTIAAASRYRWRPGERLELRAITLEDPGVLRVRGGLSVALHGAAGLRRLHLVAAGVDLARAYPVYFQPFLYGGALGALRLKGRLDAELDYRGGALRRLRATLNGVSVADRKGRFGLEDAGGTVGWTSGAQPVDSDLQWRSAALYRIPIGAVRLRLRSRDSGLRLLGRARIPILDGALKIDDLRIRDPGTARMRWQFAGLLTPVSLRALTRSLGWTPFAGKLSGMIPRVRYRDHRVTLDGVLLVRVFGGDLTVRDLVLRHPFGVIPDLRADLRVRNLDLGALTRTFPFGNMQGRLDGYIRGLRLENWRPVAFDARFETPAGDRSRHRISQQAVKSLTRIGGGGIGGLLSGTFLRLFHEFSYRRIGIGCVLRGGVCDMSGIGPAPGGGYYLVEGGGLPRISIVGFVRRVDWGTLVDQVRAVIAQGAAAHK